MKINTLFRMFLGMVILLAACQNVPDFSDKKGWTLQVKPRTNSLHISHKTLGPVLNDVRLYHQAGQETDPLTGWNVSADEQTLTITTSAPVETKWTFSPDSSGIDISTSDARGMIRGNAPAGEKRIPARTQIQDNDIMFTQMGLVSATNIHHLFDMPTDIMIQFPEPAALTRNTSNRTIMKTRFPVAEGKELELLKNYYTEIVGLADHQKTDFKPVYKPIPERFKTAPTGWSSWYCYYMAPTGEDLWAETKAMAEKLKPYGLEYIQLDAAFTRGAEANWLNWTQSLYPKGGKAWFDQIRENGLKPGLWINIYGSNYTNPAMANEYPEDFFLHDKNGDLSSACCSADSTVVRLDYTNPEVIETHLKPMFETLVKDWGLTYLKDAGWGTWMDFYEENRENAYDPDADSRNVYRKAQEAVREVMGDDNYILGCAMHEIGVGFGYFDGSRTGGDDYAQWTGEGHWSEGMQTYFNSLFGANFLNGITWWSDPDDVMVRAPLNMEEGQTIVSSISLTGQAYMISDFIAQFSKERLQDFLSSPYNKGWAERYPDLVQALPDKKLALYEQTMPAMPIKAMDLYPYKTKATCCPEPQSFPKALDLKVHAASGTYDVVALYNWAAQDTLRQLNMQNDLGLTGADYLAFDFWNKKLLGTFSGSIETRVPAHGTKALLLRKVAPHPQLLATSRHLTAAYSIQEMAWQEEENTLSGQSKTVPGDRYTLYIHVPEGMNVQNVEADAKTVMQEQKGNVLEVSFTGQKKPVSWSLVF